MKKMDEGYDVVIASRALPESNVEVGSPGTARTPGRLFNFCVRLLALPGLQDTRCGFKRSGLEAAEQAFAPSRLDGFSFDVEALFIARRRGFRIAECARHLAQRRGHARRHLQGRRRLRGPGADPLERLAQGLRRSRPRARRFQVVADLGGLPRVVTHPSMRRDDVFLDEPGADRRARPPRTSRPRLVPPPRRPRARPRRSRAPGAGTGTPRTSGWRPGGGPGGGAAPPRPR